MSHTDLDDCIEERQEAERKAEDLLLKLNQETELVNYWRNAHLLIVKERDEQETELLAKLQTAQVTANSNHKRADELAAQLAAVTAELDAACNAAGIKRGEPHDEWIIAIRHDHADMVHKRDQLRSRFERTAPVDWRDYEAQEPRPEIGAPLPGEFDEVEP